MSLWGQFPWVEEELEQVETRLIQESFTRNQVIRDVLTRLVKAGGKRIRPALVLISGGYGRVKREKLIPLAASVEMLHMATLIHDDVIDNADYRRGIPAAHKQWNVHTAIFAGDYLFSKAFGLITDNIVSKDAARKDAARIAKVFRLICEGEIEQYYSRHSTDITVKKYLARIRYKTALLFAMSCYLGAAHSDISPREKKALRNFGLHTGMAFQIQDDLLDLLSTDRQLGKPVINDLRQGIYTLPVLYALSSSSYGSRLKKLLQDIDNLDRYTGEIVHIIEESGSLERTREMEARFMDKAKKDLSVLKSNKYTDALEGILEFLGIRARL